MQQYRDLVGQYGPDIDVNDTWVVYAWGQCLGLRHVLENAQPTREGVIEPVGNLDDVEVYTLLPGITLNTDADDGYPIETMQLVEFDGTEFVELGALISHEGETTARR